MRRTSARSFQKALLSGFLLGVILILSSCSFPGMVSTNEQLPTVSQVEQPLQLPPIRLPQDEASHKNLTEWWYYTGHLEAKEPDGKTRQYGFELVIFQVLRSDLPPLYASHFAISDLSRGEFHYDQRNRMQPEAIIPNGTSTSGINVGIGDWTIKGVNGQDQLTAKMKDYAINLILRSQKPVAMHNENGLITYGLAGYSYYYSRTRMEVSGTLLDHQQELQVTGQAWMDHQWGDFLPLDGGAWDWYSFQLEDQSEIMLYYIRDATGKTLSTYVGYIDPQGNDYVIPEQALSSIVLAEWTSPVTGITYPSGWQLEINHPHLQTTLTVKPLLKDQELVVYESTGNVYWEGAVSVQGQKSGQPVEGKGYVELTGYKK